MNNMTGDPNQENRPSIFGFEAYPPHIGPIDWSRIPIGLPAAPGVPPSQFQLSLNYQQPQIDLGNFSFCTTATPHPAQFPFPTSPTVNASHGFGFNPVSTVRCKRKTDSPPPIQSSCKQHITEEKMAEHMSRLHISSEMATTSKESDGERTRRLYMCEEMRKLQSDSILPQSLLSRIQRPCTALVLWTPPRRIIGLAESENGNNNEEDIPDNNQMDAVGVGNDPNNMDLDNM